MTYKQDIPSKDDLKLLEELKKYPSLYKIMKEMPKDILPKIDKVLKAFYS